MTTTRRDFEDLVVPPDAPALPVDDYLVELDALIARHDYFRQDRVVPAIAAGAASRDVVKRLALELYSLGRWMTPELPTLVANAPDVHAFTMDHSVHYEHWTGTSPTRPATCATRTTSG